MWEVAGSLVGEMMAQGKYDEVAKLRKDAMARFGNTNLSTLEALAKEQVGPSKLGGVSMDSKYKGAQDQALDKLMGISNAGGMDAQSVARMNAAKQEAAGVARGMQGAANQGLARRGMLGSGAQVQGALSAQQGGIDRAYQGDIKAASDASERALQALMAGGNMARGMGQTDLAQKNAAASADDRIAQFNLGHKTNAEQAVINAKMGIAGGMNGVGNQMAGDAMASAERTKGMARGVGKAAGTAWNYGTGEEDPNSVPPPPEWKDPDAWDQWPGGK